MSVAWVRIRSEDGQGSVLESAGESQGVEVDGEVFVTV